MEGDGISQPEDAGKKGAKEDLRLTRNTYAPGRCRDEKMPRKSKGEISWRVQKSSGENKRKRTSKKNLVLADIGSRRH